MKIKIPTSSRRVGSCDTNSKYGKYIHIDNEENNKTQMICKRDTKWLLGNGDDDGKTQNPITNRILKANANFVVIPTIQRAQYEFVSSNSTRLTLVHLY
jgi:alpha-tubulin suppressor-like RCC1 family protein